MEMFGCRVYALTNQAYHDLVNAHTLLQSHAVPAFLKGLRDRNAAQEVMKFRDPKSIQEAVVTITHIQGASRVFGNRGAPTGGEIVLFYRCIQTLKLSRDSRLCNNSIPTHH